MALKITNGGDGRATPFIDIADCLNGMSGNITGAAWNVVQRAPVPMRTVPSYSQTGVPVTIESLNPSGARVLQHVSNAGTRNVLLLASDFAVPWGRAIGQANGPDERWSRPLCRYTVMTPVRTTVDGAIRIEAGLMSNNGGMSLLGAFMAATWTCDPAVNGGAWTPQFRTVDGGAITAGTSSGVVRGTTWRKLAIRMTELPAAAGGSLWEWLLDDALVFQARNLLFFQATVDGAAGKFGRGTAQGAGTTVQWGEGRYVVEELG